MQRAIVLGAVGVIALTACGASTPGDTTGTSSNTVSTLLSGTLPDDTTRPTTTPPTTTVTPMTTAVPISTRDVSNDTTTTADTTTTIAPPVERSGADVGPGDVVGDPVAIRIASLGVDSPIVTTGLNEDGTVAVPPSTDVAGWFDQGPRPGERGPAVVMAHVDSARTGPGVFYRLRDIQVGAIVTIDTVDGPIDFVTERIEQHPKIEFPSADVYGPVPGRDLRLVTCGGEFDRSVRSYYDNIIVYLVRSTP